MLACDVLACVWCVGQVVLAWHCPLWVLQYTCATHVWTCMWRVEHVFPCIYVDLTCKRGSAGQSEGLSIPRSSVRFRQKPYNSNSHEFELHRPSNKGTKLLLKVIKAIIIICVCAYIYISIYLSRHVYIYMRCVEHVCVCVYIFVYVYIYSLSIYLVM